MAKENQTGLKTASVLAFERKLDPSDAWFFAGTWESRTESESWPGVAVHEKSVRGTISNRLKTKDKDIDPAKLDAEIEKPNLQRVDVATLPADADTLKVRFTLRVLGGAGTPSACNNADYQKKLQSVIDGYAETLGYQELARRYACNLANGRFLWRNRVGAETVEVQVRHMQEGNAVKTWTFDALAFSLRDFDAPAESAGAVRELAAVIEGGLSGKGYALLEVVAFARMGDGQEVYPSQELILDKGTERGGQKSKTLYTVNTFASMRARKSENAALSAESASSARYAGMHSQKLGNAIRTIDTWYQDEDGLGPIAVEPYGSVTSRGKAYRQPKQKLDFYTLLDNWVLRDQSLESEQKHYVMATLIRGGVFGDSGKE